MGGTNIAVVNSGQVSDSKALIPERQTDEGNVTSVLDGDRPSIALSSDTSEDHESGGENQSNDSSGDEDGEEEDAEDENGEQSKEDEEAPLGSPSRNTEPDRSGDQDVVCSEEGIPQPESRDAAAMTDLVPSEVSISRADLSSSQAGIVGRSNDVAEEMTQSAT